MNSPCNRGIGSNTRVVPSDHFMTRVPFSVGSTDRIFKPQTHFMAHPLSQRRNAIAFAGAIGQIPVSLAILVREGLSRPEAVSLALAESYRQAAFPATNTMRPCLRSTHGHEAMSVANRRRNTFSRRSRKTCSAQAYLSPSQAARRLPVAKRILRTWYGRRRDPSPAWARQTAERSHWLVSTSIKTNACTVNTSVRFFEFHSVYQE